MKVKLGTFFILCDHGFIWVAGEYGKILIWWASSIRHFFSHLFLDYDVENDLHIGWILQGILQHRPKHRTAERMQFLLVGCPLGLTQPDLGPLGLSAVKKNPPPKVLSGSKCCLQLFWWWMERATYHVNRWNQTDSSMNKYWYTLHANYFWQVVLNLTVNLGIC